MKHKLLDIDLYDEHEFFQTQAITHVANLIIQEKAHFIRKSRHGNMHVLLDREREDPFDCPARQGFTKQLGRELIYSGRTEWVEATLANLYNLFELEGEA